MILGSGDIASVLTDREDVIFFASGVSNSKCTDVNEYQREIKLLIDQAQGKHIVYFSSLCIYYAETMYSRHKIFMENFIKNHAPSYTIIRLGNIAWGSNPNTLINYLKSHPDAEIQNTYRHIVSLEEFKYWMGMIPVPGKNEMNISGKMIFVPDLVKLIRQNVGSDVLVDKASGCRNGQSQREYSPNNTFY